MYKRIIFSISGYNTRTTNKITSKPDTLVFSTFSYFINCKEAYANDGEDNQNATTMDT